MNGDSATNNDLIYIPRDQSEMNFAQFTSSGRTFTAAEQAAAFDAYISQDKYLSQHRGEYAQRGAVFLPMVTRADLSITQDVFGKLKGTKHTGQFRIDILNVGNLLNSDWGVGQRVIRNQILTNAAADSQGRPSYRMAVVQRKPGGEFAPSGRRSSATSTVSWSASATPSTDHAPARRETTRARAVNRPGPSLRGGPLRERNRGPAPRQPERGSRVQDLRMRGDAPRSGPSPSTSPGAGRRPLSPTTRA